MERENILYKQLAQTVQARKNCAEKDAHGNMRNPEWFERHGETIEQLVRDFMPSGSGWDCGTKIDLDASHADKLVFFGSFHHTNDGGMYDGWTEHTVTVTPSLSFGYHIRVSGRNRSDIKEHLHETFSYALETRIAWSEEKQRWIDVRYLKSQEEK